MSLSKGGPIAWMAQNHVAANLLMVFFIAGGLVAFKGITQEVFPDIQRDVVSIRMSYPGAGPEEVEQGIVLAIEERLTGLAGIDEVTATASEGRASIEAELVEGADVMQVYQDIKNEVDRIVTFPEEAEEPEVSLATRRREVLEIAIYGEATDLVLKKIAERVRDQMLQHPSITQIDIDGSRSLEITVEVSQEQLRRYELTISDLANRIRTTAVELPGGGLKTQTGEVLVRMDERRDFGDEFEQLPVINSEDGAQVLLGDMAEVRDGLAEKNRYSLYNGKPSVMLEIYRIGKQTPTEVAKAGRQMLEEIQPTLPEGIEMTVRRDMSIIYQQRARLLLKNGVVGLCLVLILLGCFLELKLAFWVMMGIPISFMGSLILMPLTGLSINMVTMFAYIVALGIVVDDAIVVGENIYRHHQEGLPFIDAAIVGVREVATPVTFSILTNMVAFIPIAMLSGTMGRIMAMLPVVVVTVFMISWIESVFILPAHLGGQKDRKRTGFLGWVHEKQQAFSFGFKNWVITKYAPFLGRCVDHRYLVVTIALAVFVITIGFTASGRMGFEIFPRVESDYAFGMARLSYGAPIEETAKVADQMYEAVRKVADEHPDLVEGIYTRIGDGGTHGMDIRAYLAPPEVRNKIMGTQEFIEKWRETLGRVKGVQSVRFMSDRGGPGRGPALTVELSHTDVKVLEAAAAELGEALSDFPRVSDIDDGVQLGKQQLSFSVRPEGRSLGLTAREVARQVRYAYEGIKVIRQQRGRNELTVRLRLPEAERISEGNLDQLILFTPKGGEVPLKDVVDIERGRAYTSISHRDGRRTMSVTADIRPRSDADQVIETLDEQVLPGLKNRHPGLTASYQGSQADQRESVGSLVLPLLVVLALIYALLAIPFRSYIQPMIVMMSIPFGIVGAVAGHLIMGYSLSMMSIIGIVALSGVVVNDALIFVDFANRRRADHATIRETLTSAGVARFRPIMLTTLTTFGGLAPMIFETSRQARFLIPMAISLGYGLLFATSIILLLVPCLYHIIEDVKGIPGRRRKA